MSLSDGKCDVAGCRNNWSYRVGRVTSAYFGQVLCGQHFLEGPAREVRTSAEQNKKRRNDEIKATLDYLKSMDE